MATIKKIQTLSAGKEIERLDFEGLEYYDGKLKEWVKGNGGVSWGKITLTPLIHLVGSFDESSTTSTRYVYINGTKYNLDKDFDFTLEGVEWESGTTSVATPRFSGGLTKISGQVRAITYMGYFFNGCKFLQEVDLSKWNTKNVTDMTYMFRNCIELTSLDLNSLNTSNVTDMSFLFESCSKLNNLKIDKWDVGKVEDFSSMFMGIGGNLENKMDELDLSSWNFSSATTLVSLFSSSNIKSVIINYPNMENVNIVTFLFNKSHVETVELKGWKLPNVTSLANMMGNCLELQKADLREWDVSNVTSFSGLFNNCPSLTDLNIKDWDFNGNTSAMTSSASGAFMKCNSLTNVIGPVYNIKANISFADSSLLTVDSAMVFINGLSDKVTSKKLTFHTDVYSNLSPEQLAVATAKGWSVVSA